MTPQEIFEATCRANPHVDPEHIRQVLADRPERDRRYKAFMDAYAREHAACPKCQFTGHTTTLAGYALNLDSPEDYRDLNDCRCLACGDVHTAHERVPEA